MTADDNAFDGGGRGGATGVVPFEFTIARAVATIAARCLMTLMMMVVMMGMMVMLALMMKVRRNIRDSRWLRWRIRNSSRRRTRACQIRVEVRMMREILVERTGLLIMRSGELVLQTIWLMLKSSMLMMQTQVWVLIRQTRKRLLLLSERWIGYHSSDLLSAERQGAGRCLILNRRNPWQGAGLDGVRDSVKGRMLLFVMLLLRGERMAALLLSRETRRRACRRGTRTVLNASGRD